MDIHIINQCKDFDSYRAARVKSLFNAERGDTFELNISLPIEAEPWGLGLIVGPSGSGKTSIGKKILVTPPVLLTSIKVGAKGR